LIGKLNLCFYRLPFNIDISRALGEHLSMARSIRIKYEEVLYHLMARGNRQVFVLK